MIGFNVDLFARQSPPKILLVDSGAQNACDGPIPIRELLHDLLRRKIDGVHQGRDERNRGVHSRMYIEMPKIPCQICSSM